MSLAALVHSIHHYSAESKRRLEVTVFWLETMSNSLEIPTPTVEQRLVTPHMAKRERSDGDKEPTRRVLQRTEETPASDTPTVYVSIKKLIHQDLRSTDEGTLKVAVKQLSLVFKSETTASEARCQNIQKEFSLLGGHNAIVTLMNTYPYWRDIQYYSLGILQRASFKNTQLKAAIGGAGGVQAVLRAMTLFYSDEKLQYIGLKALLNLCSLEANATLLVIYLNALPFIFERMNRFAANEKIIFRCCLLLHNLSLHEQLRQRLFRSGAVLTLYSAALRHEKNEQIREHARTAVSLIM